MYKDVQVYNIQDYLSISEDGFGEKELEDLLSEFSCIKNPDVERFLKNNAIEFAKKHQSVTYLVFSNLDAELLGYFTLAIKPISVKAERFSNTIKRKIARVSEFDEDSCTYTLSAYLIAQLGKNFTNGTNERIQGNQLLEIAIETVKQLQYMAGGMVVFLEAENEEKLMRFYEEQNNFKKFDTRKTQAGTENMHDLIQLLKIL